MAGLWRWLVGLHREIESTAWGGVLLVNIWPAYLFALPLAARIWALLHWPPVRTTNQQARLLEELVTIVFLGLVVGLFVVRRRAIYGRRADWRQGLTALVGTFLLNLVGYLPIPDSASTSLLLASSSIIILGTLLTMWSLATLGRCFGLLPEVRGLVLGGPYRLVRHPAYVGEVLSAVGLLIAKLHPVTFILFGIFVALQYLRTVYEERALAAVYCEEYRAYQRRVPRLVPGWRTPPAPSPRTRWVPWR